MHSADSHRQENSTSHTLPEDVDPFLLKVEEKHESNNTVANCNKTGSDDEACRVHQVVVTCPEIANVVHANDGQAGDESSEHIKAPPDDVILDPDLSNIEGETETDDREDAGQDGVARAICHLQVVVAISQDDGAVADEVHTPDAHQAH